MKSFKSILSKCISQIDMKPKGHNIESKKMLQMLATKANIQTLHWVWKEDTISKRVDKIA